MANRSCSVAMLLLMSMLACGAAGASQHIIGARALALSPNNCFDVGRSAQALRADPGIARACRSTERRNGKSYAMLERTVARTRDRQRNRFDVRGSDALTFNPTLNMLLTGNDVRNRFDQAPDATKLAFHVPDSAEAFPVPWDFVRMSCLWCAALLVACALGSLAIEIVASRGGRPMK
jgi:hypothetical protein